MLSFLLLYCVNANSLAVTTHSLEFNLAVNFSKQGVIRSDTDVLAGMDVSTSLANENVAGKNKLTVSTLYAKTLGLGITAVLGRADSLFMSEELKI